LSEDSAIVMQGEPMNRWKHYLPYTAMLLIAAAMLVHGPIPQPQDYHAFADGRERFHVPNVADVASNLGFLIVGVWGLWAFRHPERRTALGAAWPGYVTFYIGVALTAIGSGYYHLEPDNARLFWDRLPIAIACSGLLAAAAATCANVHHRIAKLVLPVLVCAAALSVVWWSATEARGVGDLRPYLLIQVAPLVMIPLWQWAAGAPRRDRVAFGIAILLYVLAKIFELYDHEVFAGLGIVSGHTIKHLLAVAAVAVLTINVVLRENGTPRHHTGPSNQKVSG